MEIFVSFTAADDSFSSEVFVHHALSVLRQSGHQVNCMLELTKEDHAALFLHALPDFMNYAFEHIGKAEALLLIVTGPRLGYGALLEVGYAIGKSIPVYVVRAADSVSYLEFIVEELGVFSTEKELSFILGKLSKN